MEQLAKLKREENARFRLFLKKITFVELDSIVSTIAREVTDQIDCTQCGNCCRHLELGITDEEAGTLAEIKQMSKEAFIKEFTSTEPHTGIKFLDHQPCIFFENNLCTIYENRPQSCRDFPHVAQQRFKFRIRSILANYGICPIVFNTIERLKAATNFNTNI